MRAGVAICVKTLIQAASTHLEVPVGPVSFRGSPPPRVTIAFGGDGPCGKSALRRHPDLWKWGGFVEAVATFALKRNAGGVYSLGAFRKHPRASGIARTHGAFVRNGWPLGETQLGQTAKSLMREIDPLRPVGDICVKTQLLLAFSHLEASAGPHQLPVHNVHMGNFVWKGRSMGKATWGAPPNLWRGHGFISAAE